MTTKSEQTREEERKVRDRTKKVLEHYGGYTDSVAINILANTMGEIAWTNGIHVGRSSTPNESVIHVISLCKRTITDFLTRDTGMYSTNLILITRALDKMENGMLIKNDETLPNIWGQDTSAWVTKIEDIVGAVDTIPDSAKYAIMAEVCKAYENSLI